ncbi:YfcE family phosphodiesterase [Anaerobacillus arseniciselenatis]|uniref:Phosphoesterase n=1 Tax=Anaerobacillus arseniciselenatis TaxID=85682 RepID=A0A1S2LD48_9BACI|nr:metallophosphoesterase [Anaerobacillus arseniciselenatis]OIJ10321.1 YfcE family phosphodiesterase [Anaerobacillus arseniciselenatis]
MRVLIISDSHGLKEELFQVFDRNKHKVDLIIHCGDSELPKQSFSAYEKLLIVGGNCDFDKKYEEEIFYEKDQLKVFVTHGHLHNVKMSAVKLSYRAEELGAKLVCFGHSHIAAAFVENGVLYINPGSFRLPRKRLERSYAIVDFEKSQEALVTFYDHLGNEVADLKENFKLV